MDEPKVVVEFATPDRTELERMAMLKRLGLLIDGSADLD
jgi:hypothetical protein